MKNVFKGGCQCGKIRYKVTGKPLTLFTCHCKECQKQSASAFGMALWIQLEKLDMESGTVKTWIRQLSKGGEMACDFCPDCGTRVFHRQTDHPEMISIKPGTLDDTSWLQPAAHIWRQSAQHWIDFKPGDLTYNGNPDSYNSIIEAYSPKPD